MVILLYYVDMKKYLKLIAAVMIAAVFVPEPDCLAGRRDKSLKKHEYRQEYAFSGVRSIVVKSESSKIYKNGLTGEIDVMLIQSKDEMVVVYVRRKADVDVFKIEKIGNTLKLNAGDKAVKTLAVMERPEAVVEVYTQNISNIEMGGANDLSAKGHFTGKSLHLNIYGASDLENLSGKWSDVDIKASGASEIELKQIEVNSVDVKCSGASEVKLSGQARTMKVSVSGSSDVDAEDLAVVDVDADLSGASDVKVNVSGTLKYKTTGSSDIEWTGSPRVITK